MKTPKPWVQYTSVEEDCAHIRAERKRRRKCYVDIFMSSKLVPFSSYVCRKCRRWRRAVVGMTDAQWSGVRLPAESCPLPKLIIPSAPVPSINYEVE